MLYEGLIPTTSSTSSTQTQLSSHIHSFLDTISPEKDVAKLKSSIPHALASAIPDPILYEHGLVGECNDLIFGFSLVDYATANVLSEGSIPKIVRICIEEIDKRGLECEGIYRVSLCYLNFETYSTLLAKVSGRQAVVQAVRIHLSVFDYLIVPTTLFFYSFNMRSRRMRQSLPFPPKTTRMQWHHSSKYVVSWSTINRVISNLGPALPAGITRACIQIFITGSYSAHPGPRY